MKLEELRKKIDVIDSDILKLINKRYRLAKEIGEWKRTASHKIYVPEREKSLLSRLEKVNKGPMPNQTLRAIYREIMSGAIALEKPLSIGFLGPEATFTHLAALGKFGHGSQYVPKTSIPDIFHDVETERVDYGVVPIENSTEGAVNHTLDMFINSTVKICSEVNMRIHHNLLANCEISQVKRIYSHAQVLGQSRSWLQEHMPGIETVEVSSSTRAAELASKEAGTAAVASTLASEIYKLKVLAEHIEDSLENTTRFMVIGRQEPLPTGDDKTSICYAIHDRVGALYDTLLPFKKENITLTMIESRPSGRKNWEYCFFVDFLGHVSTAKVKRSLEQLNKMCRFVRILGSYPRSKDML